jgi:ketosteroid isomerase-like protein
MARILHFFVLVFILSVLFSRFNIGQTQQSVLKEKYDSYIASVKEGDIDKIISFYTSDVQKEIMSQIKGKEERAQFLLSGKAQIPESYEILHMESGADSQSITLNTVMQFSALKEIGRERSRIESEIHFKKESGEWKLESVFFLNDPDKIIHPADLTYNPDDADLDKEGNVGGRIVSIDFKSGYTIVIIRVLDEEDAVFLPKEEELSKDGYSRKELVPWNVYEFYGHPHKTDKLKFFATSGNPVSK